MALEALVENHPDLVKVGFRVAPDIRPIQYLSGATLVGLSRIWVQLLRVSGPDRQQKKSDPTVKKNSIWILPSRKTDQDPTLEKQPGSDRQEKLDLDPILEKNRIRPLRNKLALASNPWEKLDPTLRKNRIRPLEKTGSDPEKTESDP